MSRSPRLLRMLFLISALLLSIIFYANFSFASCTDPNAQCTVSFKGTCGGSSSSCNANNDWIQYTVNEESCGVSAWCNLFGFLVNPITGACVFERCCTSTTSCSAADKCGADACPWGGKYICPGFCLGAEQGCGAGTTAYKEACNGGVATKDYKGDCYSSSGTEAFCGWGGHPACGSACTPQQQCGNGVVEPPNEQCDGPNTNLWDGSFGNTGCPQSQTWCNGPFYNTRDAYGNCNCPNCAPDWASFSCSRSQCGAQCDATGGCPAGQSCDMDTCTCTSTPCTFCSGDGSCNCGETQYNCPGDCGSPTPIETCTHTISWNANTDCGSYVLMWCFSGSTFNCMDPGPYCAPCVYPTSKSYDATVAIDRTYNWKVFTKLLQCDSTWHEQDSGSFTPSGSSKTVSYDADSNACGSQMYMEYCTGDRAALPCATFSDAYGGCTCISISGHSSSSVSLSGLAAGVGYYWKLWAHEESCGSTNEEIASGSFTDNCCAPNCNNWPSTCAETMPDGCGGTCTRNTDGDSCGSTKYKTWNDYCSGSTQWCDRNSNSAFDSTQTHCDKHCSSGSCNTCSPSNPGCGTQRTCPSSSQTFNDYCYNSTIFCDINGDNSYNNYVSTCTNACNDATGCAPGSCTPTNPGCGHQKMCVSIPSSDSDGGDKPNITGTCTVGSTNGCSAGIGCNPVPGTGSGTDSCQGTCPGSCMAKEYYPTDNNGDSNLESCTNKLYNPDVAQGACNLCSQQWLQGGETIPFGEYAAGNAVSCCGDDTSEYVRTSEAKNAGLGSSDGTSACCDASTDCTFAGVCYPTGSCRNYTATNSYFCDKGKWRLNDPDQDGFDSSCENYPNDECAVKNLYDWCGLANCPACLFGTTREDTCTLAMKPVLSFVEVSASGYKNTSGIDGRYAIAPIDIGIYTFTARKLGYLNAIVPDHQINPGNNYLDINLTSGSGPQDCEAECTTLSFPKTCGPCDCINGCSYADAHAQEVCLGMPKDSIQPYNATHEIRCCEGTPYVIERIPAIVYVNSTTIITIQRVVWMEGKLLKMFITVFE